MKQVKASLAFEGMDLDADQLAILERVVVGEIDYDQAIVDLTSLVIPDSAPITEGFTYGYTYPGSFVLKNKLGLRTQEALDRFERGVTAARMMQLREME